MPRNLKIFLIYVFGLLLCSCGSDTPLLEKNKPGGSNGGSEENITGEVSIAYLKSLYVSTPKHIQQDIYIQGRVVSTDRSGNFYNMLCVEDETGGIAVRLDKDKLFEEYPIGTLVKVNCNSLTLGAYGKLLQLGIASRNGDFQTDPIPENKIPSHIHKPNESQEEPTPPKLKITDLSPRYLSCMVDIENVQFADSELGLSWSEPDKDTDRILVDPQGNTLIVRTSRKAEWGSQLLPTNSGYVCGVLSYFNDNYQLILNRSEEAVLDNERF